MSSRRSATVSTTTSSQGSASSDATCSACQRASADPRVAILNASSEVEEVADRLHEAVALRGAGGLLEPDGRLVQQLADQSPGEGLDRLALLVAEGGEA